MKQVLDRTWGWHIIVPILSISGKLVSVPVLKFRKVGSNCPLFLEALTSRRTQ